MPAGEGKLHILSLLAALRVEAVRVAFTELCDISLHDLIEGETGSLAKQDQVPEQVAHLFT